MVGGRGDTGDSVGLKSFTVTGLVKEVKVDGKTVVIKHDEIPGYMASMTMPFEFRPGNLVSRVSPGDQIRFRLRVSSTDGWVDEVEVVGRSQVSLTNSPVAGGRIVRDVDPLKAGDLMPDYQFTNEFGRRFQFSDFRGRVVAFTFIFTRCPFPNFCPRISENFRQAYGKISSAQSRLTNYHFLSISFDPAYDSPAVLMRYAQKYSYDSNHWSFATGALVDIDAITEQFGLYFSREAGNVNFNHNLRTVVLNREGRIESVLIGNEWKPEDLQDAMEKSAMLPK